MDTHHIRTWIRDLSKDPLEQMIDISHMFVLDVTSHHTPMDMHQPWKASKVKKTKSPIGYWTIFSYYIIHLMLSHTSCTNLLFEFKHGAQDWEMMNGIGIWSWHAQGCGKSQAFCGVLLRE